MTDVLVDTHSFLWFVEGNPRLSPFPRATIEEVSNTRLLSIASLWEIAIKLNTGKLSLRAPFATLIPHQLNRNSIDILNASFQHITLIATLPLRHRDPFDRMLIAQAMVEDIPILSADKAFDDYEVERIW